MDAICKIASIYSTKSFQLSSGATGPYDAKEKGHRVLNFDFITCSMKFLDNYQTVSPQLSLRICE
jgi:hypothetical protein